MGVFTAGGTRRNAGTVATTSIADPEVKINEDLYDTRRYSANDAVPEGSIKRVLVKAGAVMRQSELTALFPPATFASVAPATGATAGGTAITITGTNLDGTTAITIGGAAVTSLVVVSDTRITAVTPAGTAGAKNIVFTDDGGTVTATAAFTYA